MVEVKLECVSRGGKPPAKVSNALLIAGWRTLVESEFSWTLFFKMREF